MDAKVLAITGLVEVLLLACKLIFAAGRRRQLGMRGASAFKLDFSFGPSVKNRKVPKLGRTRSGGV